MKACSIILISFIALNAFSQSPKTVNKQLKEELAAASLVYDSIYAEHTAKVTAFGNTVDDFNTKLKHLKRHQSEAKDLVRKITTQCNHLKELEFDPAGITDVSAVKRDNLPYYRVTAQDEAALISKFSVRNAVASLNLEGLKIKVQNSQITAMLNRYKQLCDDMKKDLSVIDELKASVAKLDSLDQWCQNILTSYSAKNELLQLKLNELEENYRKKGPNGFPVGYSRIFRDAFVPIDKSTFELKAPSGKRDPGSDSKQLKSSGE